MKLTLPQKLEIVDAVKSGKATMTELALKYGVTASRGILHNPPIWCTRMGHFRLIGDYHFAPQAGRSLENLRPLG